MVLESIIGRGTPITTVGVLALVILFVLAIGIWIWFRTRWKYDIDIFVEKANGGVIKQKTWGRSYLDNGISMLSIFSYGHKDRPFPTLDCIIPAGSRPYLQLWLDTSGNFHQIRITKYVPVVIEKPEGFEQLTAKVKLPNGEFKYMGINEVIFEPDNKSDRAWAWSKLRQINDKHKSLKWWQDRAMIIIMAIAIVSILAIVFTGYYFVEISETFGSALAPATDKLSKILTVVGGG